MFPFTANAAQQPVARKPASAADLASGLKDCAERLVAALVKSLQTMAGSRTTVEGMLAGFGSLSTRDVSVAHRPEAVAALIECAGLPCTILVTLDPPLVHAIVELLAGGDGSEPVPVVPRLSTSIDQQYAQILVGLAAGAIQTEWTEQGFGATSAKRLDGGVAPDVCGPRVTQVGVVSIALAIFGVRGTLSFALPPVALDAFAAAAAATPAPTAPLQDPSWASGLKRELGRAPVKVEAFLDVQALSLGQIANLQPGQILTMPVDARSRVALICDGRTLYRGEVGQADDNYSLRVDEIVTEPKPAPVGARPQIKPLFELRAR